MESKTITLARKAFSGRSLRFSQSSHQQRIEKSPVLKLDPHRKSLHLRAFHEENSAVNGKDSNVDGPIVPSVGNRVFPSDIPLPKPLSTEDAFKPIQTIDVPGLKRLLENGLDPNTKNKKGETLLHVAIKMRSPQLVNVLLSYQADPNVTSSSKSSFTHYDLTCSELRNYSVENLPPLLYNLSLQGDMNAKNMKDTHDITSMLLQKGGDVNFIEPKYGLTSMHFAARIGNPAIMQKLINFNADVNAIAFANHSDDHDEFFHNVTPLYISANNIADTKMSLEDNCNCVNKIIKNGGDPELNLNNKSDMVNILFTVSLTLPGIAEKIMRSQIRRDFSKLDKQRIDTLVDKFMKEDSITDSVLNQYSDAILDTYTDQQSHENSAIYFTHLNSWLDHISTKDANQYSLTHSEGWFHEIHLPKKTKNLLLATRHLQNSKLDCKENFGETKQEVLKKLKDEVWHQASTYFTVKHGYAVSKLMHALRATPAQLNISNTIFQKEMFEWCKQINNLKAGENFSVGAGNLEHAVYMDFQKQKDGDITFRVFNLGGGANFHPVALDNRIFPYVIKNIPGDQFRSYNPKVLNTLGLIINETGIRHNEESLQRNVYEYILKSVGGEPMNDTTHLIPMKYQVAGNCTVKNNNFAMANRLCNKELYKYVKNFELARIKETINVSDRLFKSKELQKDVRNLQLMLHFKKNSPIAMEDELFRFLKKRAGIISAQIIANRGDRLADAIEKLKNPSSMDYYLTNVPELTSAIYKIANFYGSDKLKKCILENLNDFTIQKKSKKIGPHRFM
jgi:ankyrin repeat protein